MVIHFFHHVEFSLYWASRSIETPCKTFKTGLRQATIDRINEHGRHSRAGGNLKALALRLFMSLPRFKGIHEHSVVPNRVGNDDLEQPTISQKDLSFLSILYKKLSLSMNSTLIRPPSD